MLAQNFLPPATLGISNIEHEGLVKVLVLLEQEKLSLAKFLDWTFSGTGERFNMLTFGLEEDCGTVACIAGWAYKLTGNAAFQNTIEFDYSSLPMSLSNLFGLSHDSLIHNHRRTPAQAAVALRHYLQTGECAADWGATPD